MRDRSASALARSMTEETKNGAGARPPFRFGAVVLAAGGSTRMGTPKQLLTIQGVPLLVRAVEAALASRAWPVAVVLGHQAELMRPLLLRSPVQVVENPRWSEGMGSSIGAGIDNLDKFSSSLDGGLIILADQPQISALTIDTLGTAFAGRAHIVAARYGGTIGAPVIFGRSFFAELLALSSQEGAHRVLSANSAAVTAVDVPEGAVDLDTPEEYESFIQAQEPPH